MIILWIALVIPCVCLSDPVEWNYPYRSFDEFLSGLIPGTIWKDQYHNSKDGSYHYRYDTGQVGHSFRGETRDRDGTVHGYFGYVDPNGVLRLTEYKAGRFGYRAKTTLRYRVFAD